MNKTSNSPRKRRWQTFFFLLMGPFLLFVFFYSWNSFLSHLFYTYSPSKADPAFIERIQKRAVKKIEKKHYTLYLSNISHHDVCDADADIIHHQPLHNIQLSQSRKAVLEAGELFLQEILQKNHITIPYTTTNPFQDKKIQMTVFFYNPDGSEPRRNAIIVATVNRGRITYYIPHDTHFRERFHRETYEEAKQILADEEKMPPTNLS